jgi:hypothetical protein
MSLRVGPRWPYPHIVTWKSYRRPAEPLTVSVLALTTRSLAGCRPERQRRDAPAGRGDGWATFAIPRAHVARSGLARNLSRRKRGVRALGHRPSNAGNAESVRRTIFDLSSAMTVRLFA